MNYDMEDTQNSAPGSLPAAQVSKLGGTRKGADAQSTTKRLVVRLLVGDGCSFGGNTQMFSNEMGVRQAMCAPAIQNWSFIRTAENIGLLVDEN